MTTTQLNRWRLPHGYVARLRPDLLRNDLTRGDGLLVGGSPLRALRLSSRAREYVVDGCVVVRDRASAEVASRLLDGNIAYPVPDGLKVAAAELTVVIPVRDRAEQLERCLAALTPVACIVVDDASYDRRAVADVVARHAATLLPLDHNVGPAGARNAGLAFVQTPYVAFVDSDVEVPALELIGLAHHFADKRVALIGPLVRGRSRSERPRWFERYDEAASSLDLGLRGANVLPGAEVAWLPGACLVGRVERLRAIGGFDTRMRVGEDVDLAWRLVGAGDVVRYDPSRLAHHDTRDTLRGWLGRKYVYGTGGALLAQRHGDWAAPAVLSPTTAIAAAALLARRRWSLPVAALSIVLSARRLARELPGPARVGLPLAADVAVRGLGWGVRQEAALLLRHWWPAALAVGLASREARRMAMTALMVDLVTARRQRPKVKSMSGVLARRLDDLAYGAGLWAGALRAQDVSCLVPRSGRPS